MHNNCMHNIHVAKATLGLFTFWRDRKYEEISYIKNELWTDTNLFLLTEQNLSFICIILAYHMKFNPKKPSKVI